MSTLLTIPVLLALAAPPVPATSCFCRTSARGSPQSILDLDNNRALFMACRSPQTLEALRKTGLPVLDSQVRLLKDWGLLESRGEALAAAIPVLEEADVRFLDGRLIAAEQPVLDRVRPEVKALLARLDTRGRANAYAVLLGYVLDGMVWDRFQEKGVLPARVVDAQHPLWAGTLWITLKPRPFSYGTSSVDSGEATLVVAWSRAARVKLGPLVKDPAAVQQFINEIVGSGKLSDTAVLEKLRPLGVVDDAGRPTLPVLVTALEDPVYRAALALSRSVAEEVLKQLDLADIQRQLRMKSTADALVVAYHDLVVNLLDGLEREGLVKKPRLLAAPDQATAADAAEVVFLVRAPPAPAAEAPRR